MSSDPTQAVNDQLDSLDTQYAEAWIPEKGDKIIGEVISLDLGWSDQSQSNYPIVTIRDEATGTEKAIHAFRMVLQQKLKQLKPKVGERIGVKLVDIRPTKDGRRTVYIYNAKMMDRETDIWGDVPTVVQPNTPPVPEVENEDTPF